MKKAANQVAARAQARKFIVNTDLQNLEKDLQSTEQFFKQTTQKKSPTAMIQRKKTIAEKQFLFPATVETLRQNNETDKKKKRRKKKEKKKPPRKKEFKKDSEDESSSFSSHSSILSNSEEESRSSSEEDEEEEEKHSSESDIDMAKLPKPQGAGVEFLNKVGVQKILTLKDKRLKAKNEKQLNKKMKKHTIKFAKAIKAEMEAFSDDSFSSSNFVNHEEQEAAIRAKIVARIDAERTLKKLKSEGVGSSSDDDDDRSGKSSSSSENIFSSTILKKKQRQNGDPLPFLKRQKFSKKLPEHDRADPKQMKIKEKKQRILVIIRDRLKDQYDRGEFYVEKAKKKEVNKLFRKIKIESSDIVKLNLFLIYEDSLESDPFSRIIAKTKLKRNLRLGQIDSIGMGDELEIYQSGFFDVVRGWLQSLNLFIPSRYIFSYKRQEKQRWDISILVLAIQNSLAIPLQMAFDLPVFNNTAYHIFDNLVDICFFIDIILMFSSTYTNSKGQEIWNPKDIAFHYMASRRFYLDTFSMLGASFISYFAPALSLFGFLKVTRVFRMGSLIARANLDANLKAVMNFAKLTFYLAIFLHCIACFTYIIMILDKDTLDSSGQLMMWYPPLDFIAYWESRLFEEDYGFWMTYTTMLYYALLFLGFNEIAPVTEIQLLYSMLVLLFSSLLNALLFSDMAVIVEFLQQSSIKTQAQIDQAYSVMINIGMTMKQQNDINVFFSKNKLLKENQETLDSLLNQIAPSLKMRIFRFLFSTSLKENEVIEAITGGVHILSEIKIQDEDMFFACFKAIVGLFKSEKARKLEKKQTKRKNQLVRRLSSARPQMDSIKAERDTSEFLYVLVSYLGTMLTVPEDLIVRQFYPDDRQMFYVIKGDCVVTIVDNYGKEEALDKSNKSSIKLMVTGESFGEISLIYNCPRQATVISRTYNMLGVLNYQGFRMVTNQYSQFTKQLKLSILKYQDERQTFLIKTCLKIPFFDGFSPEQMLPLIYSLKPMFYDKGSTISREGWNADKLFIIENGCVEAQTRVEGLPFILERLYRGSVVNFRAFIMKDVMHVTYRCVETTFTYELDEKTVDQLQDIDPLFSRAFKIFMNRQYRTSQSFPLDYIYGIPENQPLPPALLDMEDIQGTLEREAIFKNLVFRVIVHNREKAKKPQLSEILKTFPPENGYEYTKLEKEIILEKLNLLYGIRPKIQSDSNPKFERMTLTWDRLYKVLRAEEFVIDSIDQRLNKLSKRKTQRIYGGEGYMRMLRRLKQEQDEAKRQEEINSANFLSKPTLRTIKKKSKKISDDQIREVMELYGEKEREVTVAMTRQQESRIADEEAFADLAKIAGKPDKEKIGFSMLGVKAKKVDKQALKMITLRHQATIAASKKK